MIIVEPNTSTELIGPSFVVSTQIFSAICTELTHHKVLYALPNVDLQALWVDLIGFLSTVVSSALGGVAYSTVSLSK